MKQLKERSKKNKMKNKKYMEIKILQKNERIPVHIVNDTISIINKNEIRKRKLQKILNKQLRIDQNE